MNIILAVHQFLPGYFAGTEVLTYNTAKELQKRGHQVEVWTGVPFKELPGNTEILDKYSYDDITVQCFRHCYNNPMPLYMKFEYEYNNKVFAGKYHELLKTKKPDLLHVFHLGNLSASLINECNNLNIPVVFTATDFWFICPKCQLLLADKTLCSGPDKNGFNCLAHLVGRNYLNMVPDWLINILIFLSRQTWWPQDKYLPLIRVIASRPAYLRKVFSNVKRVLVPTKLMKKAFIKNGMAQEKIHYMPYGINIEGMELNKVRSKDFKRRVGFIGTLAEHKGAHVLLEALHLLPEDLPLQIYIYGKLEEYPDYTGYLKELAGDDLRVFFAGTFPPQETGKVLSQLDCLVVPSLWYENTPLVIYYAQAANTPVIATNLGGMTEVIEHEYNGLLFEQGNSSQLASLLKRICEDRTLIPKLSDNSKKPKPIPEFVNELEVIYNEVLLGDVSLGV